MILQPNDTFPDHIPEFYQMLDWAHLTKDDYINIERITIFNHTNQTVLFAQIYVYKLIANYTQLYIPRGPILYTDDLTKEQIQEFWDNIDILSKKYNAIFTLVEPSQDIYNNYSQLFDKYTKDSTLERLPHQTSILDLTLSEDNLLKNMHSKMRYNINLAKKKGVQIKSIDSKDNDFNKYFEAFWDLIQTTSQRGEFAIHSKRHYQNLLNSTLNDIKVFLMIAEYNNQILAANIILDTPRQRIYLHGASSNQSRNLMAPPLLQWEAIRSAQKLSKTSYDFWGTSSTKKSWQGISRFKSQFGGKTIDYPASQIIIHKPIIFTLYSTFRKIRGKLI